MIFFPFMVLKKIGNILETLAEMRRLDSLIPFDLLIDQNNIFSPFELNGDWNLPLIDSDLDVQFYNNQCNNIMHSCDY